MQLNPTHAIDAPRARRPGVPEMKKPAPVGSSHWTQPDKQTPSGEILKDPNREELTATFGTGPEPSGLSGALRRVAYGIPDYRVKRWLLLLVADRVDAFEYNLVRLPPSPMVMAALGAATAYGIYRVAKKR